MLCFWFFFSALVQQLIKKCFVQTASFTRQMFCFYRFHFFSFFFINAISGERCENQTRRNLWSQHCNMCKFTSFTHHSIKRKKNCHEENIRPYSNIVYFILNAHSLSIFFFRNKFACTYDVLLFMFSLFCVCLSLLIAVNNKDTMLLKLKQRFLCNNAKDSM